MPENEELLIRLMYEGDKEAFSMLFYSYKDKLYSFIYRITGSRVLSEDILQDVFLKLWKNREQLQEVHNFNAFLFTVARNHALNLLKRMAKETLIKKQNSIRPATNATPHEQLQFKNLEQTLKEIVKALPAQQQMVYHLSREQHLKQEEIARQMHISVSTVQNHMTRALKTIREELGKQDTGSIKR